MKNITFFCCKLLFFAVCTEVSFATNINCIERERMKYDSTPKLTDNPSNDCGNPILDFKFMADPTAIVHDGRVYVYGTNDSQAMDSVGRDNENNYGLIRTLLMTSTNDMVNWTYHGEIKTTEVCKPWAGVSWAPSIVARKENDGMTHFYMFFANGGSVGLMTSTSPVGPWKDPVGRTFFDYDTPGLGDCACPFDPGAVIDENGIAWVSFGGGDPNKSVGTDFMPGNARIAKLTEDMLHIDSISEIPAPYHFEANELNYINGTWVYTYNTSWRPRDEWPFDNADGKPSTCCMSYMTSRTPLDSKSWVYQNNYLKNPGENGYSFCNNHTTLLKYEGQWYLFYHNMSLKDFRGMKGGFRSVCVDCLDVDEQNVKFKLGSMTMKGPTQIRTLNPYEIQQAETVAGTIGVKFEETEIIGNTILSIDDAGQSVVVRGVNFNKHPKCIKTRVKGNGTFKVCIGSPKANPIAIVKINSCDWKDVITRVNRKIQGVQDLYFISIDGNYKFDQWVFTK